MLGFGIGTLPRSRSTLPVTGRIKPWNIIRRRFMRRTLHPPFSGRWHECGTGVVVRLIAPIVGQSSKVVGLDFDPVMLSMAKSLALDVEWQEGDLQNLSFADDLFDLVICQQGLQFLADPDAGLRQIYRVLRPVDAWCWPCGRSSQNRLVTLRCFVPWVLYWALTNPRQRGR
jgi:SAM-dependent methyltransferase